MGWRARAKAWVVKRWRGVTFAGALGVIVSILGILDRVKEWGWLAALVAWAKTVWGMLAYRLGVPVILILLVGAWLLWSMARRLLVALARAVGPEWTQYRADAFYDLVWRWDWRAYGPAGELVPHRVAAFCPRCDCQLEVTEWSGESSHHCPSCHFGRNIQHGGQTLASRVEKLILRELNTGGWRNAPERVEQLRAPARQESTAPGTPGAG